ncbi:MAG TPA: ATPase domain-containing protein, partial [Gemmatimonadaceae bacterium]
MSIAALRQQLADIVEGTRPTTPGLATGMAALDAALPGGGLPRGRLTEITGAPGSGVTTLARQFVAAALGAGWWVAYVDAARTLAPRDWAALGAHEGLWVVRPPEAARGAWCADVLLRSGAFGLVVLDGAQALPRALADRLVRLARASDAAFVLLGAGGQRSGVAGALQLRVQRARKRAATTLDLAARLAG